MQKQILVTGGLGYIGSHTSLALIENGFQPIIIDNLSNTKKSVLYRMEEIAGKHIPFFQLDILNQENLYNLMDDHQIEGVIHFAAYKAVGESVNQPLKYYENNIGGLISLLKVMHAKKVHKIVFSSSCTIYGEPDKLPVSEDAPIKAPTSPYGATKQMGEQILKDAPLECVSLRYFNPIGAHPSAKIGEMPLGIPNNLIPYVTQTAIGRRKLLTVNGNDYPTPDGTNIRDYIDVMDLADAHVAALQYQFNHQVSFESFNIGTGKGASVLEIIKAFEEVNKVKLDYKFGPRREGDIIQVYGDANKAKKVLGWEANRSISESLRTAWNWEKFAATFNE
jgi:UDP-glucose 4-epimerase